MKQQDKSLRWSAAIMFATALLSGCSTVSDVASSSVSALSNLNPFGGGKEVAPASDVTPATAAPAEAIRVEAVPQEPVVLAAMPAPEAVPEPAPKPVKKHRVAKHKKAPVPAPVVAAAPTVQATVAGNTQCTTFCALPMHKPQTQ